MISKRLIAFVTTILMFAGQAVGENSSDWPAWRGLSSTGNVAQGTYPVNFDAHQYKWRTELPGKGCSTPIVLNRMIYLTAPVEGNDAVLCFDAEGREQWRTKFGKEDAGKHRNGSGSNASPVTDGKAVFAYFKSGTLAGLELNGSVHWSTNLTERFGKENLFWDHGSSPVLTEKHVIMARMHDGDSWLAAFDKTTGEVAWKVARNYKTPTEGDHGYTTPLVIQYEGKEAILVWGAEHVTIHDASDGRLIYSCGNFNPDRIALWPAIASPVVVDDMVVVAYGRNDQGKPRLHGVRLSGNGDVSETNHIWVRDDVGTFVPTPAVHEGRVLILGDQGEMAYLDPKTGDTIWEHKLPKHRNKYYASPLIAGNRVYAAREDGEVSVGDITEQGFRVLAQNEMEEPIIGCLVPYGNGLLIRGENHLFLVSSAEDAR